MRRLALAALAAWAGCGSVVVVRGIAATPLVVAWAGGGQGGCSPPCTGGDVCCDLPAGRRCVAAEACR